MIPTEFNITVVLCSLHDNAQPIIAIHFAKLVSMPYKVAVGEQLHFTAGNGWEHCLITESFSFDIGKGFLEVSLEDLKLLAEKEEIEAIKTSWLSSGWTLLD